MKRDNPAATEAAGPFTLPPLPFAQAALSPIISARTLRFHHGKHHKGYVDKLNALAKQHAMQDLPLVEVIRRTQRRPDQAEVFNNAAQVWNHNFYWQSLSPATKASAEAPRGELARLIEQSFGGMPALKNELVSNARAQFGSGWVWLVRSSSGLRVIKTANAEVPFTDGHTPLLTVDVWEHAYYLDYQNRREDHVSAVVDKLLNWKFAEENLALGVT